MRDGKNERQTTKASPTGKRSQRKQAGAFPDDALPHAILHPELASPATVLQLQRMIGNQATQRLLRIRHRAPANTVQRAETGLRKAETLDAIVGVIHQKVAEETLKEKAAGSSMLIGTFLTSVVHAEIKQALETVNVVAPRTIKLQPGLGIGMFDPSAWTITLDPDIDFPGKTRIGQLDIKQAKKMVNTVCHESRHCEQYFRVAQMWGGKIRHQNPLMLDAKVADEIVKQTATPKGETPVSSRMVEAMKMLSLPLDIVLKAVENSITPSTTGKRMDEAKAWYESIYGTGSQYRKHVMDTFQVLKKIYFKLQAFKKIIDRLTPASSSASSSPSAFSGSPIVSEQADVTELWEHLKTVTTTFKTRFTTEKDKLYPIPTQGVQKKMYDHIVKFLGFIGDIDTEYNAHIDPTALWSEQPQTIKGSYVEINAKIMALFGELDQAYRDFAEEKDAFATGKAAEDEYDGL